jgi:hypothetical protein
MKRENEISNLFKTAGLDEPSDLFTSKVMQQVHLERLSEVTVKAKSIININILRVIALSFSLIIVLILAFPGTNNEVGRYSAIFENIGNFLLNSYKSWAIIPVILSSAFILLLIDNFLNDKRQKKLL